MRYCFLLLLSLFTSGSVFAAPALVVEQVNYDFGEIVQGAEVTHNFRFYNGGNQMLEISRLRSSCGCTAALLTTSRLSPGSTAELQLKFNSRGFRGAVQKEVTFETNDPGHSAVTFSLQGNVRPELFLQPHRINWGVVGHGALLQAEVEIFNESTRTITLHAPEITNPGIIAQLSPLIIAPGERAQLKVSAEFPADKKRLAGYIIIKSDFSNLPQLRVPVSARLSQK